MDFLTKLKMAQRAEALLNEVKKYLGTEDIDKAIEWIEKTVRDSMTDHK